jgi:plastocyanin
MEVFLPVRFNPAAQAMARPMSVLSALVVGVGLLVLAACGSSSSTTSTSPTTTKVSAPATTTPAPPSSAGQHVSLESNPEGQLKYTTSSLTAKAGAVSIDFTNKAPLSHNLTVASSSGEVLTVQ